MSQFPIPNRQRRKSNLGKRNRTNENLPRMAPVFAVPHVRSLGRSKSAKKVQTSTKVENPSVSTLFAKKRLFLLSPQNQGSSYLLQEVVGPSRVKPKSPTSHLPEQPIDVTLNETGVNILVTSPSPNNKNNTSTSSLEAYFSNKKIEPPESPKFSHYSQLIFSKYADLKPPVDPDDSVKPMESLTLTNSTQTSTEGVKEASYSIVHDRINCPSNSISEDHGRMNYSSNSNSEDLDTTDSFILAEQTIINQNETITQSPVLNEPMFPSKSIVKSSKRLDPVLEEEQEVDSEDELLQKAMAKLNMIMVEVDNTKTLVQSLMRKRRKQKTKDENKENCPTTDKKQIQAKWISELKSENPGLLKTPKPLTKERLSLAQQCTWTPHSLSFVLNDQMDSLFE